MSATFDGATEFVRSLFYWYGKRFSGKETVRKDSSDQSRSVLKEKTHRLLHHSTMHSVNSRSGSKICLERRYKKNPSQSSCFEGSTPIVNVPAQ
jgi:hypothetical protein